MAFRLIHQINRTRTYTIDLFDEDSNAFIMQTDDEILVNIYRQGETDTISLSSWEVEDGGSFAEFTAGTNDATFKLAQADVPTTFVAGIYDIDIFVLDDSERVVGKEAAKHVESGVIVFEEVSTGSIEAENSSSSSG